MNKFHKTTITVSVIHTYNGDAGPVRLENELLNFIQDAVETFRDDNTFVYSIDKTVSEGVSEENLDDVCGDIGHCSEIFEIEINENEDKREEQA